MAPQVIQLTDIHLVESPERRVMGVDTEACFHRVLASVAEEIPEPDLVVVSGDLAHDESRPTYERLRALLREYGHLERCRLVPGNHDDPQLLRQVFGAGYDDAPPGSACFAQRLGDWTVLGLDSHFPGELGGKVGAAQIEWLFSRLAEAAESPTLLFLHHPPGPIGTPWLDGMAVLEPGPLVEALAGAPRLRAILCGHVHQDTTVSVGDVPLITTPSTCFQFLPGSTKPAFDEAVAPAFRIIELEGDAFQTRVVRVGDPMLPRPPA
jgi:Icc protein